MIKFAPEGYPFIAGAAVLTLIVFLLTRNWLTVVPVLLTFFMFYFFRDPERVTPKEDKAVVSPADGEIIVIKDVHEDEHLHGEATKISIFMSPFNVHVNRAPYPGTVKSVTHTPGSFKKAFLEEASLKNENIAMVLNTDQGGMLVRQIAGAIARRAVCRVKPGDELAKGERYGLIKFSSRVDLYVPRHIEVKVKLGDMVRAGETILGHWTDGKPMDHTQGSPSDK